VIYLALSVHHDEDVRDGMGRLPAGWLWVDEGLAMHTGWVEFTLKMRI